MEGGNINVFLEFLKEPPTMRYVQRCLALALDQVNHDLAL